MGSIKVIDDCGTSCWYKNDVIHQDEKDLKTGLTLPAIIDSYGNMTWVKNGQRHRDDKDGNGLTLPARELKNGTKFWYKNGQLHRDDKDENGFYLPTATNLDGAMFWYKNGKKHQEQKDKNGLTLPAIVYKDGTMQWYKDGMLHREDFDPKTGLTLPAVIWAQKWFKNKQECELFLEASMSGKYIKLTQTYPDSDRNRIESVENIKPTEQIIQSGMIDGKVSVGENVGKEILGWYKNGRRHRMDGPAMINSNANIHWFINGVKVNEEEHPWCLAQKDKEIIEMAVKKVPCLAAKQTMRM